jgi:hypothetical protein
LSFVAETTIDSINFSQNSSLDPLPLELPSDSLAVLQDDEFPENSRWNNRSTIFSQSEGLLADDILVVDDDGAILDVDPTAVISIRAPSNRHRLTASSGAREQVEREHREALGNIGLIGVKLP